MQPEFAPFLPHDRDFCRFGAREHALVLHPPSACARVRAERMKEELPKNEDLIFDVQNKKVVESFGRSTNRQRRCVSALWVCAWLLLPLVALHLWLLRLLDVLTLPF